MATAQILDSKTNMRQPSIPDILPPEYAQGDYVELTTISTRTSQESLPSYDNAITPADSSSSQLATSAALATTGLQSTHTYQIETKGHPLIALPLAPRPEPIGIFAVLPNGELGALTYQSLRHARCSGNSVLVRADDDFAEEPLSSTAYRFGPGRPPKIQLQGEVSHEEEFEVTGKGIHTRAQNIRTHLGTFQWRYASRQERRAIGASSLLVCDQVTSVALLGGKQGEKRRRVAQLVRSEELRTKGTSGSTAGNGGRLVMDLREWEGRKSDVKAMEVLVLTGCVMMLKKEVDRRRAAQFMVMAGAAGGGP
ncbi:hypothetical protein VFPPC_00818 [Pochonia chlamydosporia 170]|uniref:Uncharacterized protein n=1 Tax=Pochonia chlamydosporia 170 TaxID=1380566 RepID=A0A179G662_METCM|nr:hypothetical protein VFPPC_00818 [Pochonia chlamydosporia 170]OAQ72998.1 hypothetical protein VFPPC_00818 [Pochonia chlamydosporia 170]